MENVQQMIIACILVYNVVQVKARSQETKPASTQAYCIQLGSSEG